MKEGEGERRGGDLSTAQDISHEFDIEGCQSPLCRQHIGRASAVDNIIRKTDSSGDHSSEIVHTQNTDKHFSSLTLESCKSDPTRRTKGDLPRCRG
jgi:hypothetical protein